MANEVTLSVMSDSQRELIVNEILETAADIGFLPNHPAIYDAGSINGSMTDTIEIRDDSLTAAASLATIAESGSWANTAYTDNAYTVAVAEKYIQYTITDLVATINNGTFSAERFALKLMSSLSYTWAGLVAGQVAALTNVGLDSGSALTVPNLYTAAYVLETQYGNRGRKLFVCSPKQAKELAVDAQFTQASNAAAQDPRYLAMRKLMEDAYVGYLPDIDCDVIKTAQVSTSGGKYLGGMFCRGAIGIGHGTPAPETGNPGAMLLGPILMDRSQDPTGPRHALRGKTFMGCAVWQQYKGVLVKSAT